MTGRLSWEGLVHRLRLAAMRGDRATLHALLHLEVIALVDSGGDVIAPTAAITGRDAVAGELIALLAPASGSVTEHPVNAAPALIVRVGGRVVAIVGVSVSAGVVTRVWITRSRLGANLRHVSAENGLLFGELRHAPSDSSPHPQRGFKDQS